MLNTSEAKINKISIHEIGVKNENEGIKISDNPIEIGDEVLSELLFTYFFKSFKVPEYYKFTFSNGDVNLNPMFNFVRAIFDNPELAHNQSIFIAKHLYEQSSHPNIKAGDLLIAYIEDLVIDEQMYNAIGIFKAESRDSFLQFKHLNKQINLDYEKGVNVEKLDKGCLILNDEESDGFKICIVDKANKNQEAQYWREDFLNVVPKDDDFHNTANFIDLTTSFVKEKLASEYDIEKFEEAGIINRSKEYFKRVDRFEEDEYTDRVFFSNKAIMDDFKMYKNEFEERNNVDLQNEFFVSPEAFKKKSRFMKSIIKLDKNFHIYVHGNHDMIEKDKDEKGTFYKVYYYEES
ncbi:MAG: nucleoid-associated protein [Chitinophagales bacterium]|nr:nucleoid-associated protein [Chitinophagales bacterium]